MPATRKRSRARVPLSDGDLYDGKTYYSAEEIEAILKVLKPYAGFDQSAFVRRLEGLASWYLEMSAYPDKAPASTLERSWRSLASSIENVQHQFSSQDEVVGGDLLDAAQRFPKSNGLPDFSPALIDWPATDRSGPTKTKSWPVEKQMERALANLTWLHAVAKEAESRAKADKGVSGKRSNELRHELVRNLMRLYIASRNVDRVDRPYFDSVTGRWRKKRPLNFLRLCITPIEAGKPSDVAIARSLDRAWFQRKVGSG